MAFKELTDAQKKFVKLYSEALTVGEIPIGKTNKIAEYISARAGYSKNMAIKNLNNKYIIPHLEEVNENKRTLDELQKGTPAAEKKEEQVGISENLRAIGVLSLNDVILPTLERMRVIADEAGDVNMLEKVLKMILEVKKNFDDKDKDYAMMIKSSTMEGLFSQLEEVVGKIAGVDVLVNIIRKVILHEPPGIVGHREHE